MEIQKGEKKRHQTSSAAASLRLSPARQSAGKSPPLARTHPGSLRVQRGSKPVWDSSWTCSRLAIQPRVRLFVVPV